MTDKDKKVSRLLDANMNRAKEGLRVCEDICRFIYDQRTATKALKDFRQELTAIVVDAKWKGIILSRAIESDVGRGSTVKEMKRKDVEDVLFANLQRAKESLRVLEEFAKLFDAQKSKRLKAIRYKLYALEKRIIKAL